VKTTYFKSVNPIEKEIIKHRKAVIVYEESVKLISGKSQFFFLKK
jgi:hypothetical protein